MPNIEIVLKQAIKQLNHYPTPRLEAELLLAHSLGKPRSFLRAFTEYSLSLEQLKQFKAGLARRCRGEPLAYIFAEKEFFSLSFKVTSAVLIPRAETELLVEKALAILPAEQPLSLCDLGTGSGAIALTLAKLRPAWRIVAVDSSAVALAVAVENAKHLAVNNVEFINSDWLNRVPQEKFDAVISNPPYIDITDPALEKNVLHYEPTVALIAADHGLAALKTIATQALSYLSSSGWLLLEHGYQQASVVTAWLQSLAYQQVATFADFNQLPRVTIGQCQ